VDRCRQYNITTDALSHVIAFLYAVHGRLNHPMVSVPLLLDLLLYSQNHDQANIIIIHWDYSNFSNDANPDLHENAISRALAHCIRPE